MAQILYRTRGQVSPQGKPRVYFACHAQDHTDYFQEITNEILQNSDCAVFYYAPGEMAEDEERFLNLSQMQLVVIPVTSRLLYSENRAMDVDFAYAIEHHIPVLPLMQEQGLTEKYREKFGDLQYLQKHGGDTTELPYEEKLKKYLESVLVGDELAEQIRAAFDAYIFLSYRKKDRKYAQELMRLLHRDPACRDIAIWYDEFLTPGESFNDSIRQALEKSGLFVLAVTPNLVNESNYVMNVEYPMAKDAGKPILPAEMVVTDDDALQNYYPGIPEKVNPDDDAQLSDALVNALGKLTLRENDQDPKHNFFIGLAYLGGIDVEVDHERAAKLIRGAAEAGLPEAMEKLVFMYENGEGVQRDYYEAIRWREHLTELTRLAYVANNTQENAELYVSRLWDTGDAWKAVADLERASELYGEMCSVLQHLCITTPSMQYLRNMVVTFIKLGEISCTTKKWSEAKDWFHGGLMLAENLAKAGMEEARLDLCVLYANIGDIARAEGNLIEAEQWYARAQAAIEQLAQLGKISALENLSGTFIKFGDIRKAEGNLAAAKEQYICAMEVFKLLVEAGEYDAQKGLSVTYCKLGEISRLEENLEDAREWYMLALEIDEEIAEAGTVSALRSLIVTYNQLGDICQAEDDPFEAEVWYYRSETAFNQLAESDPLIILGNLSVKYRNLASDSEREGNSEEAKAWYIRSLEAEEKLVAAGLEISLHNLVIICQGIGNICLDAGDLEDAKAWYTRGLEYCEKLMLTDREDALQNFDILYYNLGAACSQQGNWKETQAWFSRVVETNIQLAETGEEDALRNLSAAYRNLGETYANENDLTEARACFVHCLEIDEKLAETGTEDSLRELTITYRKLGEISEKEFKINETIDWYTRAFEILEELVETGTKGDWYGLCDSARHLAAICAFKDNSAGAKAWYTRVTTIVEEQDITDENLIPENLGTIYLKLAEIYKEESDQEKAAECYARCVQNLEICITTTEDRTENSYDELATAYFYLGDLTSHAMSMQKSLYLFEFLAEAFPETTRYSRNAEVARREFERLRVFDEDDFDAFVKNLLDQMDDQDADQDDTADDDDDDDDFMGHLMALLDQVDDENDDQDE